MPAGKGDAAYAKALATINWNSLYEHSDGFLFFEDTKLQWQEAIKPDYVLIDSRTGHTDVGGICTRQLADAVVLLFTPNEQNLIGLENVCRDIRREETEGLKKRIQMHFVAANVPDLDDEDHHLRRQLDRFREKLEISSDVPIPIVHRDETLQMLNQPVFVLQRSRSRLAREYRRLVRSLMMQNQTDDEGRQLYAKTYPFVPNESEVLALWFHGAARMQGQTEAMRNVVNKASQLAGDAQGLPAVLEKDRDDEAPAFIARFAAIWDEREREVKAEEEEEMRARDVKQTPTVILGAVRDLGNAYGDGTPKLEIHVPIGRAAGLPFRIGERVTVRLRVDSTEFTA